MTNSVFRILSDRKVIYVSHSVHDEIKCVRTDEIARLLVETNMTVAQMAREMGFKNADNFFRYFCQAKGMSPTEYRNHHSQLLTC